MSIGFAVVMIQIVDGGAGSIWALNFSHITFEHITTYTGIVILSLGIQVFLLFITSRIVFKIRKASSRRALIIPYIYVISQLMLIVLITSLLMQQLLTYGYNKLLSQLIIGLIFIVSVLIMSSLAYSCIKSYCSTKSKILVFMLWP